MKPLLAVMAEPMTGNQLANGGPTTRTVARSFAPRNWQPLIRQYGDETSGATSPRISFPDWYDQRTKAACPSESISA